MAGTKISTKNYEEIELEGNENLSFLKFLNEKSNKTVNLERVLGIGGEGIVLAQKMDTRENHYEKGWEEKKGRDVAIKYVKFEKDDDEDFLGPEKEHKAGLNGGINGNGKWVESQYFKRLDKLGDFRAATHYAGGYSRPYIDFGVSKIYEEYFYVIGELKV